MKKTEKAFFVENLTEELKEAKTAVLIDFVGLSVKAQEDLKKKLKEIDAKMVVVKNTLLKLAGEKAKLPKEALTDTVLSGQTALILAGDDPIAPLSILAKFAKENEVPSLKVGIVEGSFQDKDALTILSNLPGKEVLQAQVIGAISAPTYGIVSVLQANLQNLVYVLEEASKKG